MLELKNNKHNLYYRCTYLYIFGIQDSTEHGSLVASSEETLQFVMVYLLFCFMCWMLFV